MVLHSVHVPHCCMHFLSDNLKKVGFTNGIYSLSVFPKVESFSPFTFFQF